MKNYLIRLLILFFLVIFCNNLSFSQNLDSKQVYNKTVNCVVLIIVNSNTLESSSQGSGVVADERGIIITNYHLIVNKTDLYDNYFRIIHNGDTIENTRIIKGDQEKDILILKIADNLLPAIEWAENPSYLGGEKIYTMSSPGSLENSLIDGIINSSNKRSFSSIGDNLIQFSGALDAGSSGGALLNENGKLIGVIVARNFKSNINFAIPIAEFWNSYMNSYKSLVSEKLDVLMPNYKERVNWYLEELSDTANLYLLGKEANERFDFLNVIFYYTLYLEQKEGDDKLFYQRGSALFRFGYDSLAFEDFKRSLSLHSNSKIMSELGEHYSWRYINHIMFPEEEYYSKADTSYILNGIRYLSNAITSDPYNFEAYEELSSIYQNVYKNFDSCVNIYSRALKMKPSGLLFYRRSNYFKFLNDTLNQLKDLNQAIKYRYNDSVSTALYFSSDTSMWFTYYFLNRGLIYFNKCKYEKAISDFSYIINMENQNKDEFLGSSWDGFDSNYYRGLSYFYLGDYEKAITDLEIASILDQYKEDSISKIKYCKKYLSNRE